MDPQIYPEYAFGIPAGVYDKLGKKLKQSRATGVYTSPGEERARIEGVVAGLADRASQAAARRMEQNRFEQDLAFRREEASKNRDVQESGQKIAGIAGLAAPLMTYGLMKNMYSQGNRVPMTLAEAKALGMTPEQLKAYAATGEIPWAVKRRGPIDSITDYFGLTQPPPTGGALPVSATPASIATTTPIPEYIPPARATTDVTPNYFWPGSFNMFDYGIPNTNVDYTEMGSIDFQPTVPVSTDYTGMGSVNYQGSYQDSGIGDFWNILSL